MDMLKHNGEKRFLAIFKHAAVGIFMVDPKGIFFEVNRSFCEMIGYSEKYLRGLDCNEISHPDDKHLHLEFFKKLAAGKIDKYNLEKRFVHSNGVDVWTRLTFSAVRDEESDEFLYSVVVVENITPQKRIEDELENVLSNIILDWNVHDLSREVDKKRLKDVVSNMQV